MRSGDGGLEISIEPIFPVVERRPSLPNTDELADAERTATLARPRADAPRPLKSGDPFSVTAAAFQNPAATAMVSAFEEPDKRSVEEYGKAVDRYSKAYSKALQSRCVWRLWRHRPICLRLEAVNLTEANFTDIELEIHVSGDVRSWPEELDDLCREDEPALPERPAALGTPKRRYRFGVEWDPSSLIRPPTLSNYRVPSINTGPNFTVRDTGSVTIDFDGIDLRPEQRLKLPPVRLLVESPEGSILDVEWKATAGNVPRRLTGSFRLTVGASTLSFDDIKVDRETDVNEDEDDD